MEIGIVAGCFVLAGGLYELFRPKKKRNNFSNNKFLVFYDNFGIKHILKLNPELLNRNNSETEIENNTKSYIAETELGICTISQENIVKGDQVRELNCGHYFKKEYIDIWLSENNVCPMCRKNFKVND